MIPKQRPKVRTHSQLWTRRIILSQKEVTLLFVALSAGGRRSRQLEAMPGLSVQGLKEAGEATGVGGAVAAVSGCSFWPVRREDIPH